ncbi:MAG: nickel-binding protein [Candidatus Dadabacteria bacterium]
MPIYMDVHIVPGVKSRNVAEAHRQDLFHEREFGCKCMTYWIDEIRESIFCLIEAPDKESVEEMHRTAHGLVPNKVIEVNTNLVESFLGRIYDPEEAEITGDGLKVFNDPSFRVLVVTKTEDPVLLQYKYGTEKAHQLLDQLKETIRRNIAKYGGGEVEQGGMGFIISFASAAKAVSCALDIQKETPNELADAVGFRIGINAGEPVEKSNKLFGDTVQKASNMCAICKYFQVALSSSVRELVAKDHLTYNGTEFMVLSPQDEALLELLFNTLEENWQDPEFDMDDYCQGVAMSKSQLYRKTIALTGMSPNQLLKEFRLEKAKEMMCKQCYNIAQVTFDSGFTSPSYFTKCFKKKYGLLPNTYMELLH